MIKLVDLVVDEISRNVYRSFLNDKSPVPDGKYIKSGDTVYLPGEYITEVSMTPLYNYGTNAPHFTNKQLMIGSGKSGWKHTAFKVTDRDVFVASIDPSNTYKFAYVQGWKEDMEINDIIDNTNLRNKAPTSVTIVALQHALGVLLDYLQRFAPDQVSFAGLLDSHHKLYSRVMQSPEVVRNLEMVGYGVSLEAKDFVLNKLLHGEPK